MTVILKFLSQILQIEYYPVPVFDQHSENCNVCCVNVIYLPGTLSVMTLNVCPFETSLRQFCEDSTDRWR